MDNNESTLLSIVGLVPSELECIEPELIKPRNVKENKVQKVITNFLYKDFII